jgi:hypothetical protein
MAKSQWALLLFSGCLDGAMGFVDVVIEGASAFDNAKNSLKLKKPLRDNDLTDSIEVNS